MTHEEDLAQPAAHLIFAALANSDRLALLDELRACGAAQVPGLTISELASRAGVSRFTASRYLTTLDKAGLVAHVQTGAAKRFSLRPLAFERIDDWILPFLDLLQPPGSTKNVLTP